MIACPAGCEVRPVTISMFVDVVDGDSRRVLSWDQRTISDTDWRLLVLIIPDVRHSSSQLSGPIMSGSPAPSPRHSDIRSYDDS